MKIAFCAAEASPFAKIGGLGDVIGSLPKALANLGEDIIVCIPYYGCIASEGWNFIDTGIDFAIGHRQKEFKIRVLEGILPGSSVVIYFFDNPELYGKPQHVYILDDPEFEVLRFEVFGKAVLQFLRQSGWKADLLHLHDWHTANLSVYLKEFNYPDGFFKHTGTVLTLHNMAYQGIAYETNWLQEGLIHSDALVAVSPSYAREIMTESAGAGLESVVRSQQHKLYGILNGIDTTLYNPATDLFIPYRYDSTSAESGKGTCKRVLQQEIGLPPNPDVPLFGMVTRIVEQKGFDLLIEALRQCSNLPAQFAILGTGEMEYERQLKAFNTETPNIRSRIEYNVALGQLIYAGSDMFLMPSRFEPCGLGQMIALRYGSLPVVRKTGGLADTIIDLEEFPDCGNGFLFEEYTTDAIASVIRRAASAWQKRSPDWWSAVRRGMARETGWEQSAQEYRKVYESVHQRTMQEV